MKLIRKYFSKTKNREKEIGAGIALGVGGIVAGDLVTKKSGKYLLGSKITAKDEKIIRQALIDKAKSQGIKVVDTNLNNNSAYVGSSEGKAVKKGLAKVIKKLNKSGNRETAKTMLKGLDSGSGGILKHLGKDRIILGKGNLSRADVLSHELGHAQYMKSGGGRSKNIIAKTAHKLNVPSKIAKSGLGVGLSAVHGFKSGVKSEKLKQEGKKESKWNKVKSIAVPALAVAPLLTMEGAASLKGLKMMKQAGASKELLNQSKKRLGAAFGTYAGQALKPIVAGEAGRIAGKGYAKMNKNKKKKEKE